MSVKRMDESTSKVENVLAACYDDGSCPPGYKRSGSKKWCVCIYFGGGWKRDTDIATVPQVKDEISKPPFDPRAYCANTLKGKCPEGTTGLWTSQDRGHCYCGAGKTGLNLLEREQAHNLRDLDQFEGSQVLDTAVDLESYCIEMLGKCPAGTKIYWSWGSNRCSCAKSQGIVNFVERGEHGESLNLTESTTPYDLTSRLLPAHLTFPSEISDSDWTAIELTLVLLDESIQSQAEFQRICLGARNPEAYGFKLNIFRKICAPEITIPVSHSTIMEAEQKVLSAQLIDTILQQNSNNFRSGCEHARSPGAIPSTLDQQWILFQLCHANNPAGN